MGSEKKMIISIEKKSEKILYFIIISYDRYHVTPLKRMEPVTSGITTSSQQSVLHIDNLGALSAGRYLCQVFNNFDNKSTSANLTVTCK
jgi:hypothetical protein